MSLLGVLVLVAVALVIVGLVLPMFVLIVLGAVIGGVAGLLVLLGHTGVRRY